MLEVGTKGVPAQTRLERFKCRARVLAGGPVFEGALAVGRPSDGPDSGSTRSGIGLGLQRSEFARVSSAPKTQRRPQSAAGLRGIPEREHRFLEGQS